MQLRLRPGTEEWASNLGLVSNNPQGNPWRIYANSIGPEVPTVLGFRAPEPHARTLETPTQPLLQSGVQALNEALIQNGDAPIPLTFHTSPAKESSESFLRNHSTQGSIPIADPSGPISETQASLYLHDISFHVGAIYLPPRVVLHSRAQVRTFLEFIDYLKTQEHSLHQQIESLIPLWTEGLAIAVDTGTGNFATRLGRPASRGSRDLYEMAIDTLCFGGLSPEGLIKRLATGARNDTTTREITSAFERFKRTLSAEERAQVTGRLLIPRPLFDAEVEARRTALQRAAHKIQEATPDSTARQVLDSR